MLLHKINIGIKSPIQIRRVHPKGKNRLQIPLHPVSDNTKTSPFSRFRKSFPTSFENQGSKYIKIVSTTVCTEALEEVKLSKWVVSTLYTFGIYERRGTGVEWLISRKVVFANHKPQAETVTRIVVSAPNLDSSRSAIPCKKDFSNGNTLGSEGFRAVV